MKLLFVTAILFSASLSAAQNANIKYVTDSASEVHTGVPKGEIIKFTYDSSLIFPGTVRECWIYVPAQYQPSKPACVYVNQDGVQWNAPIVFDNLINSKEMPVTIGIFISPGRVKMDNDAISNDRFNRSFEYDGLGDAYARFILTEIFPAVQTKLTSNGRAINLSKNGNDHAIGGSSSGAVCAFTAAWENPHKFSRVFSAIGTYVGLRGADEYSTLVRKYEPKKLRIFLQDGANDLNIYAGDWWKANESMERSLSFAGYEVNHVWAEGNHNGDHGTAIFPAAMRYLWKGWPAQVVGGVSKNQFLNDVLIKGEDWQLVGEGYSFSEGIASNANGEVFFQDIPNSKTYKISADGSVIPIKINSKNASGTCFDSVGNRYVTAGASNQIIKYDSNNKETILAENIAGNDLIIGHNGNIYITVPEGSEKAGKVYLLKTDGKKILVDEGLKFVNGITFSPDQCQLYIAESASHWIWIYKINADGTLYAKQKYGWLHTPDNKDNAWPDGIKCDTAGRIYVTTRLGIQVLDQLGRVNAIIPIPAGQPSNCAFGGINFNTLFVTCGKSVYKRKLKVRGVNSFNIPYKPSLPNL